MPHALTIDSPSLQKHPHACAALAEALLGDSFYQAVTMDHAADPARRQQVLEHYWALDMDEAQALDKVHLSGSHGAALWITPHSTATDKAQHSARRTHSLRQLLGPRGFEYDQRICASMKLEVPADLHSA